MRSTETNEILTDAEARDIDLQILESVVAGTEARHFGWSWESSFFQTSPPPPVATIVMVFPLSPANLPARRSCVLLHLSYLSTSAGSGQPHHFEHHDGKLVGNGCDACFFMTSSCWYFERHDGKPVGNGCDACFFVIFLLSFGELLPILVL